MKFLNPSQFVSSIEYTSERVLRLLGARKACGYRMSNSELTEPKYYFKMKCLGN